MLFAKYGQAVLAVHERHSRLILATRPPNKAAEPIAEQLLALFAAMPPQLRQTITFDNGTEFARHRRLHALAMQTFFCDTYAPWQKGGIENAIGRLRRFIARKTDLAQLDRATLPRSPRSLHHHSPQMPRLQNPSRTLHHPTLALPM